MNYWLLSLSLLNVLLIAYIAFNHLTQNKAKAEDQRLTKGLQLLQNKISILQDLSDKTDEQVRKWVHLIEQKSLSVQTQLNKSDEKVAQIENALSKALDVSKIFYEQVPHAEIAERQKTGKYVQAAKLANQGFTADQISQKIDLSKAEIEMISKMNREELQFAEESLPAWVDAAANTASGSSETRSQEINEFASQLQKMNQMVSSTAFDIAKPDMSSMNQIQQQFKNSLNVSAAGSMNSMTNSMSHVMANATTNALTDTLAHNSTQIPQTFLEEQKPALETRTESGKIVRPFEFRKITK